MMASTEHSDNGYGGPALRPFEAIAKNVADGIFTQETAS